MKKTLYVLSLGILLCSLALAASPKETLEKIYGQSVTQNGETLRIEFPRADIGGGEVSWIEFTPKYGKYECSGDLVLLKKEALPVKLNFANTVGFSNITASGTDVQHLKFQADGDLSRIANDIQIILYYDTKTPMGSRKQ